MLDRTPVVDSGFEVDPDALKAAELLHAQLLLDALIGKTIAAASVDRERAVVSTTDGMTLIFCSFGGMKRPRRM